METATKNLLIINVHISFSLYFKELWFQADNSLVTQEAIGMVIITLFEYLLFFYLRQKSVFCVRNKG